jgi:hypothetical protein
MVKPDLERIIQPAQHLELVFGAQEEEYRVDMRDTVIYDVYPDSKSFIVAQTEPPVLKSMTGNPIESTFLWLSAPGEDPKRYAFHTGIQELITHYSLSLGQTVQALRLAYPKGLYERNIRFSYRVKPVKQYPITLWVEGHEQPLPIVEVSEGGVCLSYPKSSRFSTLKPGDKFSITLDFNKQSQMKVELQVVRRFRKPGFPRIEFMGARFLGLSMNEQALLAAELRKAQRVILRKMAGLESVRAASAKPSNRRELSS